MSTLSFGLTHFSGSWTLLSASAICSKVSSSMKCASVPSAYRNCILRASVWIGRNFSPARNVRSITAPSAARRSFVRTKAPPLPGLTCWNSMILKIVPSTSMWLPFLNWLVLITCGPGYDGPRRGSGQAGPRHVDRGRQQHRLARGAARLLVEVGRGAHEQRAAVLAAEHAGEDVEALGHRDLVDDL